MHDGAVSPFISHTITKESHGMVVQTTGTPSAGIDPRSRGVHRKNNGQEGHIYGYTLEELPCTSIDVDYLTMGFVVEPLDLFGRNLWSVEGQFRTGGLSNAHPPSSISAMEVVCILDTGKRDSIFFDGPGSGTDDTIAI